MSFSLKQMKVFLAVVQYGSITAAANMLCLSKPAVSMALAELEEQLGQTLFDRVNKRLIINDRGYNLLPLADELLLRVSNIQDFFGNEVRLKGRLKIGASKTVGSQIMPFLIQQFRNYSQHNQQSLLIANTTDVCDKIRRFELDIGLVEDNVNQEGLKSHAWLQDEMLILCSHQHPLAKKKTIKISDLNDQEWVLREEGSGTRNYFFTHIAPQLKAWQIPFELNNAAAIINSVIAGLGITCISRSCLTSIEKKKVKILPLTKKLQRQYWIIYHCDKYRDVLWDEFFSFALKYCS